MEKIYTCLLNFEKDSKLLELFVVEDKEELQPHLREIEYIFCCLLGLYLQKERDPLLTCDKQWQNDCKEQMLKLMKILPNNIDGISFCGMHCGQREGRIYYFPPDFIKFFKEI